jgi:hypothetical protein
VLFLIKFIKWIFLIHLILKEKSHWTSTSHNEIREIWGSLGSNVTPYSLLEVYRNLGRPHCLHLQGWRDNLQSWRLKPEDEAGKTSTRLHGITSQMTVIFTTKSDTTSAHWISGKSVYSNTNKDSQAYYYHKAFTSYKLVKKLWYKIVTFIITTDSLSQLMTCLVLPSSMGQFSRSYFPFLN